MKDILDQVIEILRGLWRFRWISLLVAWVICLLGWAVVLMLPNKYEAMARVFVDPSTALRPVIKDIAIEQDVDAELAFVRQSLLGQAHLEKIVRQTGLANGVTSDRERSYIVDALRQRNSNTTQVSQIDPGGQKLPSRIYGITYDDPSRERSLQVVQILLDSFMEGTLGGKRQGSLEAQRFLQEQIADYDKRLQAAEQRLADFKKSNVGMVPGTTHADYFTRLQTEMDAVKKGQSDLGIASTRREALVQQLRGEAPVAAAAGTPVAPGGVAGQGGDTLSRIKETQARLDDLLLRYTEQHPDVIAARETLSELKHRRENEIAALQRGDAAAAAATGASANPVYQSIQLQLNQVNVEIAGLKGELATHQQKVTELRQMLDTTPQVEAEYARLNRDYTVTKAQYTALVERLEKARLGEEAEAVGSVRFEVIDPPSASFAPVSPNRYVLIAAVLAAAIAIGAAIGYLLDLLRPVFNSSKSLADTTGIPVFGAVSVNLGPASEVARRWAYFKYAAASSTLLFATIAILFVGRMINHGGGSNL
jgi:polysaccharide chain length determinant protein (PEP-CTERM system associated)